MGVNIVPVKDVPPDVTKLFTLDLLKNMDPYEGDNDKSRGQLVVELTYKPFNEEDLLKDNGALIQNVPEGTPPGGGLLVVIVHEAQDVEGKHHTNPQARVLFKGEQKRTKVHVLNILLDSAYSYFFLMQDFQLFTLQFFFFGQHIAVLINN